MKRLFIAEKRDIANAMADYLWPNGYEKTPHFYHNGDDSDCVTWASGHILRLALPNEYPEFKRDRINYPLFPSPWKLLPYKNMEAQLDAIGALLKEYSVVVNGGDADREGQLLVDEILNYYNYKGKRLRIFITAKDDTSMKRAFDSIDDDEKYHSLYVAGVVRDESDWLIGMNTSRAYNAEAQRSGYPVYGDFRFRIGRVKMPTLALIVRRELEIKNFKSHDFYTLIAKFRKDGITFNTTLIQNDTMEPQDENGHILDKNVLIDISNEIAKETGVLTTVEEKEKSKAPPLPHSLDTLQILANKRFGFSPSDTLDIVQQLYQKKYVTYPRSDCNYLPVSQQGDASTILKNLANSGISDLFNAAGHADSTLLSSKCWNDSKVSVHTAIIPTMEPVKATDLSQDEKDIYYLIGMYYVLQFFPKYRYLATTFKVSCGKYEFKGSGRKELEKGFKAYFTPSSSDDDSSDNVSSGALPVLLKGDEVGTPDFIYKEGKTAPPDRFTEGSLIDAMANIWKYMDKDNPMRDIIKEVKGIGTPATRSRIVEELLATSINGKKALPYLKKSKKYLVPTDFGFFTIDHIHESLTKPDLTAEIEYKLGQIVKDESLATSVREDIKKMVLDNIHFADNSKMPLPDNVVSCPICKNHPLVRHETKSKDVYYDCSDSSCVSPVTGKRIYYPDYKGKPLVLLCKKCNHPLSLSKSRQFFICNGCHSFYKNDNMKLGEEVVFAAPAVRQADSIDCPVCQKGFLAPRKNKEGQEYYSCSDPACKLNDSRIYYPSVDGKPLIEPCPICGMPMSYSYRSSAFKCVQCNKWFDAVDFKPMVVHCPKCNSILEHPKKKDGTYAFVCKTCKQWFDDVDGKPIISEKKTFTIPPKTPDSVTCPICEKGYLYPCHGKNGPYWRCSNENCKHGDKPTFIADKDGKPYFVLCPNCGDVLSHFKTKTGSYVFKCPSCRKWFDDKDGKPVPQVWKDSSSKSGGSSGGGRKRTKK